MFSTLLLASVASAGIVHLPLTTRPLSANPELANHLSKRSMAHGEQHKGAVFYEAIIQLGTPAQDVSVCFDTGSGHLWVPATNTTSCTEKHCHKDGVFDIEASTSWRYRGQEAAWGGHGIWGNETVSYAGETLDDFKLWVATNTMANNYGIFGQCRDTDPDPHTNFCQGLAASGKISRAVYSLNSEEPITNFNQYNPEEKWKRIVNNVYYGGYDRKKYEGPLTAINVTRLGTYHMPFSGFKVDGEKDPNPTKYTMVLDTGGISLVVPNKTLGFMSEKHGGEWDHVLNKYTVACDAKPVLTYLFGHTEVDVDMDQFIIKAPYTDKCVFDRLHYGKDDTLQLLNGPPLVSKMMIIYDNDRGQVLVAKAKYGGESEVVEIDGDIPGVIQYDDYLKEQQQ